MPDSTNTNKEQINTVRFRFNGIHLFLSFLCKQWKMCILSVHLSISKWKMRFVRFTKVSNIVHKIVLFSVFSSSSSGFHEAIVLHKWISCTQCLELKGKSTCTLTKQISKQTKQTHTRMHTHTPHYQHHHLHTQQRMTCQYLFSCFPNKPFTTMTVPNQDSFKRNFGTEQMTCNTHNRQTHTRRFDLIWLLLCNTRTHLRRHSCASLHLLCPIIQTCWNAGKFVEQKGNGSVESDYIVALRHFIFLKRRRRKNIRFCFLPLAAQENGKVEGGDMMLLDFSLR